MEMADAELESSIMPVTMLTVKGKKRPGEAASSQSDKTIYIRVKSAYKPGRKRKNKKRIESFIDVEASTYERWKKARKELHLKDNDDLAKYFLNLFEANLLPKQVGRMANTSKGTSSTQASEGGNDFVDIPFSFKDNLPHSKTTGAAKSKISYACNCGKRLPTIQLLETHKLEVHGQVDQYKCRHCCVTYKTRTGLTKHIARDHQGPPYPCSYCNVNFDDVQLLLDHRKTEHPEHMIPKVICETCGRSFRDKNTLQNHRVFAHEKTDEGSSGGFKCDQCGQAYESKDALSAHKCKKKIPPFSCLQCKEGFQDRSALVQHLKMHDSEKEKETTIITCGCGKRFISAKARERHRCIERIKCPHCDKTFKHVYNLKQHIAVVHTKDKPQFICKTCGRIYNRIQNLRSHEKLHGSGRKQWPCKLCSKVYFSKQSLKDHQRQHTGMALLCSYCGKGYTTAKILCRHEKIHTNNRRYRCVICHKAYYDSYNLKCHMNVHTGEKPLKCKFCKKRFIYSSARATHQRTQHGAGKVNKDASKDKQKAESLNSDARNGNKDAIKENPKAESSNPDARNVNKDASKENPKTECLKSDTRDINKDAIKEEPKVKSLNPEVRNVNKDVSKENSKAESSNPNARNVNTDVSKEKTKAESSNPDARNVNKDASKEEPEVESLNPDAMDMNKVAIKEEPK